MKAIYWRLFMFRLALRWVFRLNLGREVWYEGRKWTLVQGVRSPVWTLVPCEPPVETKEVHEKDFRLVRTWRNYWHGFSSGYLYYRTSWYDIWMRNGIEPWMIGCRIWAGKPPRQEPPKPPNERDALRARVAELTEALGPLLVLCEGARPEWGIDDEADLAIAAARQALAAKKEE